MKEIEKLDWSGFVRGEVDAAENIVAKMNEVIDCLNDFIAAYPAVDLKAKFQRNAKKLSTDNVEEE
jgi:hypothetical protein